MELAFDYSYTPGAEPLKKVLVVSSHGNNIIALPQVFQQGWDTVKLTPGGTGNDIPGSLEDFSQVPDGAFDAVFAPQNLKALPAHRVIPALGEMRRCLKEGGFLLASAPDLMKLAEFITQHRLEETLYESKIGPITPLDMLFGPTALISQGVPHMEHRTGFTALTLGRKLKAAGFFNIQIYRKDLEVVAQGFNITDPNAKREEKIAIHDPNQKDPNVLTDELDVPPKEIDPEKRT
ncbi:MAG: class I SAM-dependent methyltransferase [Alphaproteobacteria bacterium]|nr:class I SAM-dependent methyltransferase [Alphaproteobacteria bacterium]